MGTWWPVFRLSGSSHFIFVIVSFNFRHKMDIRSKDEFIYFMQRACEDTSNDCYIELYNILLRAFISADKDFDGKVDEGEFEGMINAAAAFPQKFGFEFWKAPARISSRQLTRMVTELCLSMNGWDSLTATTRSI